MNQRTLLGSLLSPAGFGLVLLLLLLPFLTVSCGAEDKIESTFTGLDLVVGGAPDIVGVGVDEGVEEELWALFANDTRPDPLAMLAVLAVLAGMGAGLIRERLAKHGAGTGLAVLAAALLTAAVLRAPDRVDAALRSMEGGETLRSPDGSQTLTSVTEVRYGFWLTVCLLAVLAIWHGLALVLAWRAPAPPQGADVALGTPGDASGAHGR